MDRVDDKDLGDERLLYRRVLPHWIIREEGTCRPQSVAFIDGHTHEVSVFVADMTSVNAVMANHPDQSMVEFQAALPRACDGIVAKTPEEPDPSHRVLCYPSRSAMRRGGKIIADNIQWVILRPPVT